MFPQRGLPVPGTQPTPPAAPAMGAPAPAPVFGSSAQVINIGGFLPTGNLSAALAMDAQAPAYDDQQNQPVIVGLAAHIRSFWHNASTARRAVEQDMIEALLARRGQYTTEKLQQIQDQRQPAIYMMVASAKMRQVESLVRDIIIGTGSDKPWTLKPTPSPELPPQITEQVVQQLTMEIQQAMMTGFAPSVEAARQRIREMRSELVPLLMEEAVRKCELMETKMEDQLLEGNYLEALDGFITDLATFKTAFIAGPIVRRKPQLSWGQNGKMVVETKLTLEWERVDPFDMYPAPWATELNKAPLVRKHRLSRSDLNEMIGVEGFSETAINEVLQRYDDRGFREWLAIDSRKAIAEGKMQGQTLDTGLIDALQYWGSASGQMLLDWGIDAAQIESPTKEYQVEAWLIGHCVIKAVLNADPLARRPYYGTSYQRVPGSVWGNSPYDLMRDCQDMCNAAARSLAANLGIASGPQVAIISNRIPSGEDVTEMYPWKIWQFESDPSGSTAAPIMFFQPESHASELMQVYERFSTLADEYTGIPRYMAGFESAGAGRTASGMSMMIGNASKVIKQVVGNIDTYVIDQFLDRLYYYNMRWSDDEELKGDVKCVSRGAMSMAAKEAAQVRTNEFLQTTNNPVDMQIVGLEGRAELLRKAASGLDMNVDKVVPPLPVLRQRMAQQQLQQMQLAQSAAQAQGDQPGKPGGENLQDGSPTSDHFSPKPKGGQ